MEQPTDSQALATWRDFEQRHPDRARMIQIAFLYETTFLRIDATELRMGPMKFRALQFDGKPELFDVVQHVAGVSMRGTDLLELQAGMIESIHALSFEPLYVAIGHALLKSGNPTPPPLDGLIQAILVEMAKDEERGRKI